MSADNVITSLVRYLNVPTEDVKPEAQIRELATDSLDLIEMMIGLEEEFDVKIEDADLDSIITVQDLVNYIHSRNKHEE